MPNITPTLTQSPIIAAVRTPAQLSRALLTPVQVIFLLGGDPDTLPSLVQTARSAQKLVFVHMDLVEGFSRDAADESLLTVLRIFMVDSSSLATGVRMAKSCEPTLIEVMPGLVTRALRRLSDSVGQPVIAGGMLEAAEDVEAALCAGALAASTSSENLWARTAWQR